MKFLFIILLLFNFTQTGQDLYTCKNARISIFSHALIEDINAVSSTGLSVFNATSGELDFSLTIPTLMFEKAFMQQHFNSDYMESDRFPKAIFKGKIQEHIDGTKDGTYTVNAEGELTVHGVVQKRTIAGTITVKNGTITMTSEFNVKCADHHIDIPQILFYHIAEVIKVNVSATYTLFKSTHSI